MSVGTDPHQFGAGTAVTVCKTGLDPVGCPDAEVKGICWALTQCWHWKGACLSAPWGQLYHDPISQVRRLRS